ncbi:Uncharacterised protein [Zhongshania aliphaticivorans]|uniref:CULT domain-containing protein n=1 Tax=Zhongshania aliphaticivorans TaxID=1470434 RepID=A0A5S9NTL0_9GAMM|nr:cereblon family protein [Zhongshania aliphaticivorans]CAA0093962.1 Uncharacterised protein [Zhongshania aliphaticivorans]CAA0112045.1 Uncharacterised protein [Zhongshania aliphaticivorans]
MSNLPIKQLVHDALFQSQDQEPADFIACRNCNQPITANHYRTRVHDQHHHRFVNPNGVIYDVCCFTAAPGSIINGAATALHCWFQDYRWQFAHCEHCAEQLGWYYENDTNESFFALIPSVLSSTN